MVSLNTFESSTIIYRKNIADLYFNLFKKKKGGYGGGGGGREAANPKNSFTCGLVK